jgi:hypothetical protein
MALSLGSNTYISKASGLSGGTFTAVCWAQWSSIPTDLCLIEIFGAYNNRSRVGVNTSGYGFVYKNVWPNTDGTYTHSSALAADTWHHFALLCASTYVSLYTNGVYRGNIGRTGVPTGDIRIGGGYGISGAYKVAEVAQYDASVDPAPLAQGVSPLLHRPDKLLVYTPLLGRATNEPDLVGGGTFTSAGSQFAHPRVIRPYLPWVYGAPVAAAAAATSLPAIRVFPRSVLNF